MRPGGGDSKETQHLLERIRGGQVSVLDELFERHRRYVRKLVELRLDPALRRRVDPSDVVQEAQLEAARRINGYLDQQTMSFRLWLRQIAYDRLLMLRRRHAGAHCRDVRRETDLPDRSSLQLARQVMGTGPTPSQVMIRGEFAHRVRNALARLSATDCEILTMRQLEGLTNQEVAEALQIEPATARKRYGRALLRLRTRLLEFGMGESEP